MFWIDFPIMRSLSRKRYAEIDALSRGAGGASQPAAGAVDDQLPGAAT